MTDRVHRAIIVAAGRGSRLAEHTDDIPKCLVPVGDRPILAVQLDAYRHSGVVDPVIIRGYHADVLTARARALDPSVRFVDNLEWEHNNILESLFCAAAELDRAVLISYGDIIFTREVVAQLVATEGDICLVIDRNFRDVYRGRDAHPLEEAEVADLDSLGQVARVGKRALPPDQAWGEFIGLLKLSGAGARLFTETWQELVSAYRGRLDQPFARAPSFRRAYLTDLLQHLIDAGTRVTPVGIHGQWREIDTVQDLERARALLGSAEEDNWT